MGTGANTSKHHHRPPSLRDPLAGTSGRITAHGGPFQKVLRRGVKRRTWDRAGKTPHTRTARPGAARAPGCHVRPAAQDPQRPRRRPGLRAGPRAPAARRLRGLGRPGTRGSWGPGSGDRGGAAARRPHSLGPAVHGCMSRGPPRPAGRRGNGSSEPGGRGPVVELRPPRPHVRVTARPPPPPPPLAGLTLPAPSANQEVGGRGRNRTASPGPHGPPAPAGGGGGPGRGRASGGPPRGPARWPAGRC